MPSPPEHRCQQCGASCEGLRVRVAPSERAGLATHAESLGIAQPFAGPWLRHNWGRCVFWSDGCMLHARFGAQAKPAVCQQFPLVARGDRVGIDPACFHPGAPQAFPGTLSLAAWGDLSIGERVAESLRMLPLMAVTENPRMGPQTRALLTKLDGVAPAAPPEDARDRLHARSLTVIALQLTPQQTPEVHALLVGGGQLVVGAGLPVDAGFAAWLRFLRTGVVSL